MRMKYSDALMELHDSMQEVINKVVARFEHNEADIQTLLRRIEKLERDK